MDPIGTRIRKRRDELGLTAAQVAERCGVNIGTISLLENGKMPNASFKVLAKVAAGLGLSLDELAESVLIPS